MSLAQKMTWGSMTTPKYPPNWYFADISFYQNAYAKVLAGLTPTASDRYTLMTPNAMQIDVGSGTTLEQYSLQSIDLSVATNWDTVSPTNYTTAANRKGLDFYIYVVIPTAGSVPQILLSASSTIPTGYTTLTSRLLGGFHCFCASNSVPANWATSQSYIVGKTVVPSTGDVGYWYRCVAAHTSGTEPTWTTTVGNTNYYTGTTVGWICENAHTLANYVAGDILPQSVWDLKHRSAATYGNIGQVYNSETNEWSGVYLTSGTYVAPTIVYAGTILVSTDWNQSMSAARYLGMKLPSDYGFQSLAAGSNQLTSINGAAAPSPFTSIEYSDNTARRMVSNIGCESCCGLVDQWLDEQSFRFDAPTAHTHTISNVTGSAASYVSNAASADVAPAWAWDTSVTGHRGHLMKQGTYGDIKMTGGGSYYATDTPAVDCGTRSRRLDRYRWYSSTKLGFRLVAKNIDK